MDFPLFHLDVMGDRLLVALTAVLHVLINHPVAVGAYPLILLMEWQGVRRGDRAWDEMVRRIVFISFIITTTVGALTGIGIWLTTSLVAPFAIGSLLRVFFWSWFMEWLVFISEVVLIMAYYLTWKKFSTPSLKRAHLWIGGALSAFSWITMALIVAILGFMMNSGAWTSDQSWLTAVFNPLYLPQLAFRTAYAMMSAGLYVWACLFFIPRRGDGIREGAVRTASAWTLAWLPLTLLAGYWYWRAVPGMMRGNADVALLTQAFSAWHASFAKIIGGSALVIAGFCAFGWARPARVPAFALVIPFVLAAWMLGHFERVREFIRKPYVIAGYMYSNGVRVAEMPVYRRDGMLPYATYAKVRAVTPANRVEAGAEVFMLACSRCHTTDGVNGLKSKLTRMYGEGEWDAETLTGFIQGMHLTRTYMPPFPGSDAEAAALAEYLRTLHPRGRPAAQTR